MTQKDLFGHTAKISKSRLETIMKKYDRETMEDRLSRLRYLQTVFPNGIGLLGPPETVYIFEETKMAFINGEFIATLLLSSAFVEHVMGSLINSKGHVNESQYGLKAIVSCARKHNLIHDYVLDKIDDLRKIRNPFAHLKPFDDQNRITPRTMDAGTHPLLVMEDDAKKALSVMYTVATCK